MNSPKMNSSMDTPEHSLYNAQKRPTTRDNPKGYTNHALNKIIGPQSILKRKAAKTP